jgi:hypothetical protein
MIFVALHHAMENGKWKMENADGSHGDCTDAPAPMQ